MTTFSKFFGVAAAMALLPMAISCSSDDFSESGGNENPVADRDHTCYVNVAISTQGLQTRADDENPVQPNEFTNGYTYNPLDDPKFEYGKTDESAINNIVFAFYDAEGNPVGEKTTLPLEDFKLENVTRPDDYQTGNVGQYYTSTVPVTILKGQAKPTQIMAFVNPSQTTDLNADLRSIMTVTRNDVKTRIKINNKETDFYSMSNSVYYAKDKDNNMQIVRAAQIPEGGAFESLDDARKAAEDVDSPTRALINVERYAAKVRFRANENNDPDFITNVIPDNFEGSAPAFQLKFNPGNWALNAIDDKTFVTKVYLEETGFGSYGAVAYPFTELNELLDNTGNNTDKWAWNAPEKYRSFWGFSPAHYVSSYPEVASDYNPANYDIDYVTYNSLIDLKDAGNAVNTSVYAKETTVGKKGFNSNNPYAALPSIVYGGVYSVVKADGTIIKDGNENITFYINQVAGNNNLYFEPTLDGSSAVEGGESIMQSIASRQGNLFLKITTTTYEGNVVTGKATSSSVTEQVTKENLGLVAQWLKIAHPSKNVLGNVKVPSRKVTIQIKGEAEGETIESYSEETVPELVDGVLTKYTYQLCYGDGSSIVDVTEDNLINANKTLTSASYYADKYDHGAAYFNIPILHLGWYRAGNPNWVSDTDHSLKADPDFSIARVGDFGIIRNHVYDILVTSISGLGTGIGNPEDPIIPENNGKTYYVNFKLQVLNWAVVPTQSVKL